MSACSNEARYAIWHRDDGSVVSCTEKVKVMNENLDEIAQLMQDALEDGILMEVSEAQMKDVLHKLVDALHNPYAGRD
ncbi:hypothetical protein [Jeongeupia sp. USM3]|uniref:hypothetical protein n=1 Tax=Jeongeupia sp. USM3 TaxID=1906741 RepID=UPI00089E0471|nr:hypothetical protein [Jeongeupia sp. USM3]AOY00465.1 hypothetical protein BJP62_08450 [Jeongeupia sp. USM3]